MEPKLSIQKLAEATNLSRSQIDQWISRGHFKPRNPAQAGKAREFTIEDAIVLGTLAELVRIGIPPATASMHVHSVYPFIKDDAVLVVSQGPEDVDDPTEPGKRVELYDSTSPATRGQIVRAADLPAIIASPGVRSFAAVGLAQVAHRVLAATKTA